MEFDVTVIFLCALLVALARSASGREIENVLLDEDEEREIVSPDYPNNFDLYLEYLWLVSTNRGRNIYLEFTELLLRETLDFFYVGDGSIIDETTVYLNLTGSDPISTAIVSSSENIWIRFTSGGQGDVLAERRFKFVMKETQLISLDDNSPTQITSKNYPSDYPNDCHQLWFVSSPSGSRIRIRFLNFAMEQEADYVTIGTDWEAVGDDDHVLVRYSGEFLPDDVVTPVGDIWLEMMTDRRKDEDGFRLTLQSTQQEPTLNNYLPRFQSLNFHSPNYPESDYPDDADITWIVTCEPSFKLLFLFDELDTEAGYDVLRLGYGTDPDDYSTMLNEFSGRTDEEGAFSISSETWLRFTTDGAVNYGGFSLQIYAVENDAELRRNISFDSAGQSNIFSPEFPLDYPIYSDELWTISAPTNHLILLQFKIFALEDARYDSLTIGTGRHPSDVDSEVIGVFGGSVIPSDIESTSPCLWVHFISDQSVCFQGFWIVVTAVYTEVQTTVIPTLDTSSSTSKVTGTPYHGSRPSERETQSTIYLYTKSTVEPTLNPSDDPTVFQSTDPTAIPSTRFLSEDPISTPRPAPSQTSLDSMMSSASGSTFISTSPWSTMQGVPGSNASQTDLKKVVVPSVIISVFVLVGLLLLVVLWRVRRSRNSPPLVDDDFDEDKYHNHINPAYEYQTIDHIKLDSTHHSTSHGRDSIKKPLPRPPTDSTAADDHRYSTYIDTMSRKMKTNFSVYPGDENDRDSGCDESGIGSEEYHRHPDRGSNIGIGLDDCADIEYYGSSDYTTKSVDGQSDNGVYQEIPYDLETQPSIDLGADKMNGSASKISNKLLKVACSDDLSRLRSDSDAVIAASLINNDLYVPLEQDKSESDVRGDEGNVADCETIEGKGRKISDTVDDAVQESLYDYTAPLDDTFYHIVMRNESDDEGLSEQIRANSPQNDNCDHAIEINENDDEVEIPVRNIHYDVRRREIANDIDNDYAELEQVDDSEAVNDPEYQIVDRNESEEENAEDMDTRDGDNEVMNDTGIMGTAMVDNELYRPLSIVEDSGNQEQGNQAFQNDTVI